LPPIRGAQLVDILDGSDAGPAKLLVLEPADAATSKPAKMEPNPMYATCLSKDQIVLAYLQQSLSWEIIPHVHRNKHSTGLWGAIAEIFAAQSEARVSNPLICLANTKHHQFNNPLAYLTKTQGFADEFSAAGCVLLDKELVSYIPACLGPSYDALVAALSVVTTHISLRMLCSPIQSYDERQDMHHGGRTCAFESLANASSLQRHSRFSNNGQYNSGHRFTLENHLYIEFHPFSFWSRIRSLDNS
jgi:hypothetical protein